MTFAKRAFVVFLAWVMVVTVSPAMAVALSGQPGLLGGSGSAPRQESGSADGLGPAPDTATALHSPPRSTAQPPGAVPARIQVPKVGGHEPPGQAKLTDVAVRPEGKPKGGYDAGSSVEDERQRAANTRVYRNADGTHTRRLYNAPIHVQRQDGSWSPVDLNLTTAPDGRVTPKQAPNQVSFGARADDETRLELDAGHSIGFRPVGVAPVPVRSSDSLVNYPQAWPNADLRFNATATGVKQDIVLHTAAARASFDFTLRLTGLRPVLDEATGDVRLLDGDAVRAVIPAGWMRDARGAESRAVRYRLVQVGGGWSLNMTADEAWLRAKDRAFPVTVDPSVHINADIDDTYVTSGAPANRSSEIQLKAGKEGNGGISAAYLHFSGLANTLHNQYINGASLVLYNAGSASCTPKPVDVFSVGASWSGSALTTWPGAPLAQHLAQKSFAHGAAGCPSGVHVPFPLPPDLVTDWTHDAPFHGFSVRAAVEGDSGAFKRFGSANAPTDAAPYMDVTYAPQGAAYRVEEVTLPTATREGRLKATVRNRGSATWTPAGPHKFGFIVKQGATVIQTSPKFNVPHDVGPSGSVALDVPIAPLTPGDYQVFMTMYDGESDYQPTYGVPYGVFDLTVKNVPPSVNYEQPGSGAAVDSITPTLYAEGVDTDNWPGKGLRFNFKLCDGPPDAPVNCVESGWTNATWSPRVGRLKWSTTYHWWVQAHDTVGAGPFAGPLALTTQVPQPEITAHLGGTPQGAPASGLSPQVGNFGTATTDADVATVGPDLTITRTYNSLDPRTDTAFGQGWASRLDTELDEDADGSGNVVVTLPSGRQVRFGRNTDGSYAPPMGQNLTLVYDSSTGYYTLRDSTGGAWQFNPWGRLRLIIDPSGLVEELEYDTAGPLGRPRSIFNHASKRRLYLVWTGTHVTTVRTDPPATSVPALEWNYSYDGHRLTSACDPGSAPNCTRYTYQTGSHYRSVVLDDNPRAYYRFGDASSRDGAASSTARKPGADKGTYTGVALGQSGPLPRPPNPGDQPDQAAEFDGAASRIDLPPKLTSPTMTLAVELWFRTTAGGVLISYENAPRTLYTPVLYVGQDGHLRGGFWVPNPEGPRQISSQSTVNDGQWHHAVLSASVNTQKLYLDGVAQPDTITGVIDHDEMPNLAVGTGKTVGWASGNNGDYFFAGGIDEVAIYQHPLGATAVAQHHAARQEVVQLTKITLPQNDRVAAVLTYDFLNDRVATYTDHDGRQWRLDNPARDEAVRTVTLHGPYPDWTYEFDADHGGRPTARVHDSRARRFAYNTAGFQSEEIDENGHKITFTTDARGNVLSRTTCRAVNSCQTAYSTYFLNAANPLDPRNDRKLSDSDARSPGPGDTTYRTTYSYDTVGRLTSTSYPKPGGVPGNPTETWRYSTGTEQADGGGTIPAGLLIEQSGRRAGQITRYTYKSNGDLAETISPTGLRIRCTYDGIGRKTSEATQFGTTEYTYTPRSQIDTMTGPLVRNTLSSVDHRLATRYSYDANGNTTQITLTDTAGADPPRTTTHEYNQHDQLVATTLPDGGRQTREYRNAGQETWITDPRGTKWITYTDSQSRVIRRVASGPGVDPEDASATVLTLETRSYDAAGRLAADRDAMGRETRYTYYDDDLPATVTHSGVVVEQREYDPAGNVTKRIASGGRVSTSTYDPGGYEATSTLDPSGLNRTTSYVRDPDGLVRTVSRAGAADPGRVESTSYGYNSGGLLVREDVQPTPGDTLSVTYVRDERGLVTQQADRRRLTTDFAYDAHGRLVTETRQPVDTWVAGQLRTGVRPTVTHGHNTFGEITHRRDPNGGVTLLSYDALGRTTSTQLPDYTPPGGQLIRAAVRTEYDQLGNPAKITDPLGRVTERSYDPHGRVTSEKPPKVGDQPNTTVIGYSRNGEQLSVTDPSGVTQLSTYDSRGRKITDTAVERQPQTTYFTTQYGYDDADNLTSTTTPGGSVTLSTFNAAGEPVTTTDPTGKVTSFAYDNVGRSSAVTDPAGIVTSTSYNLLGQPVATAQLVGGVSQRSWTQGFDPNGNLLSVTSPEGRLRSFGYDAANRLVRQDERVDANKTIRTTFGYDAAGNRTRFVDGNGRATDYTHTSWGLPESTIEPGAATWTTVYDSASQPVRSTAPGGVNIESTFDAQGRLTMQRGTGAEAPTADKTLGYNPAGRLTSFDNTPVTYDDRGNMLTVGSATYTYTADNQVATRADASGTASFSYDPAGRISSIVDSLSARTLDYTYDPAGRLAYSSERGVSQYVKRVNSYDGLGRLAADKVTEFDPSGQQPRIIVGTEYGYDRDDNITAKTTLANNQSAPNTYGYDGASRLTSFNATTYAWDDAGNRTRAGGSTFTYNDRNQLTSDGATQYTYTPRGTLASAGTRTPKFDAFDQLVQDGVSYEYDSLGRVSKRGAASFTYSSLENDVVSDGTRLVSRSPSGQPLSDSPVGATLPGKLLYSDQHGDVVGRYRGLSNFAQRTFDPFGTVTSSSGEQSGLGYQGEWTEPTTGAVNMHSRWYTPGTGTFTSRDTWTIPPHPSVAANRYTYGNASPVVNDDPTGHDPVTIICVPDLNPFKTKQAAAKTLWGYIAGALAGTSECTPRAGGECRGTNYDSRGNPCPGWPTIFHNCGPFWKDPARSRCQPDSLDSVPSCRTTKSCQFGPGNPPGKPGGGPDKPGGPKKPGSGKPGPKKPWVLPPPPPPPLWSYNIDHAPPRTPPGTTVAPRPPKVRADDDDTKVIDNSDRYAEEANKVTADLAGHGVGQAEIDRVRDELAERADEDDSCLSGSGPSSQPHNYWNLVDNKASGADACLNHDDDNSDGSKPSRKPQGWETGCGLHRGHLIACRFGGTGKDVRNLVPISPDLNVKGMRDRFESCVAKEMAAQQSERIFYVSVPVYDQQGGVHGVAMVAVGNQGYGRSRYFWEGQTYDSSEKNKCA